MSALQTPAVPLDLLHLARNGTVHFVGIGGAGMAPLAEFLIRAGGTVSGCDAHDSAVLHALRELGGIVSIGHDASHVAGALAVVTTSAVHADHPELSAARERGIPVLKRAQALGAIVNHGTVVAIAGTHGKTSTTAMTSAILAEAGLDPTSFVGGTVPSWKSGLRAGSDRLFVVEADEYDRSFHTLRPTVAVVTTLEADHLDIYGTFENVRSAFEQFLAPVAPTGLIAVCADDDNARALIARTHRARTVSYGTGDAAMLRATDIEQHGPGTRFILSSSGQPIGPITLRVPGLHNVRNALGAFAAARHVGASYEAARDALERFEGVARRFEVLGSAGDVTLVDDYAHHPTEVEATLSAARRVYASNRIVAVFQPHLFSRTRDFAAEFGRVLAAADEVWVTDVYAAREQAIPGITGELIADAARALGASVQYARTLDALGSELPPSLRAGDVCLFMGAGDIDTFARQLWQQLRGQGA